MYIQLDRLNELAQKKVERELKERNLNIEDIEIDVNGPKISVIIKETKEVIEI